MSLKAAESLAGTEAGQPDMSRVERVLAELTVMTPDELREVRRWLGREAQRHQKPRTPPGRRTDVVELRATGMSIAQIAREVGLSSSAVHRHIVAMRTEIASMVTRGMNLSQIACELAVSEAAVDKELAALRDPYKPKATRAIKKRIEALRITGMSMREIAREVGISPSAVHRHISAWRPRAIECGLLRAST